MAEVLRVSSTLDAGNERAVVDLGGPVSGTLLRATLFTRSVAFQVVWWLHSKFVSSIFDRQSIFDPVLST